MTAHPSSDYLAGLVRELCKLPLETEWVEFKENDAEAEQIGEYISALANSAVLVGKAFSYMVWGVNNSNHTLTGTTFSPKSKKIGNEELESWLLHNLVPKIDYRFYELDLDEKKLVVLEIGRAYRQPVQFKGQEFIRVGTYKKKLKEFPEKERAIWRLFDIAPFENGIALEHLSDEKVLGFIDYPSYFDLMELPLPENRKSILSALANDRLISNCPASGWDITNLGAILFAKRLDDFPELKRKAMRVIKYDGQSRSGGGKETGGNKGYACGFKGLIGYVNGLLPANEVIEQALRKDVLMYPELAIRELVANALIHQDFFIKGTGPMVEIFSDRVEITNPGVPLVDINRFVDTPPRSRNEALASLMRRIGVCEERGSGWDKIVFQTEYYQLPAPLAEATTDHTRVVLFAHRPLKEMDKEDRVRAVYLHASLRYVNRQDTNNTSLRERFGIDQKNSATASRLIKEAVEAKVIYPYDLNAAPKIMRYIPFWAN